MTIQMKEIVSNDAIFSDHVSNILTEVVYALPEKNVDVTEDASTYFVITKAYAQQQTNTYLEYIMIALYLLYKFKAWNLNKDPQHTQLFKNLYLIETILKKNAYYPSCQQHYDSQFRHCYNHYKNAF